MLQPCLRTNHLGEEIEVFQTEYGYFFECREPDLRDSGWGVTWSSHFDFATAIEAVTICILNQQCHQIDQLKHPAAIFSIETGKILHTNKAHYRWLGHGCIHMDRDSVLNRVVSPEKTSSRILSIGSRVVGVYEISGATQPYELINSYDVMHGVWEGVTAFNGFACYSEKSQEILSRWFELGDTPQFRRRYLSDLGLLDQLKGIA